MKATSCQMHCTNTMHQGLPQLVPLPLQMRFVISVSAFLGPGFKRFVRRTMKRFSTRRAGNSAPQAAAPKAQASAPAAFKAGDLVRVRTLEEIRAGLDSKGRLKGCRFMPEMEPYCGTVQRVFKPIERYLNEFDYTVRKARGLVLLENLYCQGVAGAGRCDRSCFYYWRVEWLEHLPPEEQA